MILVSVMHFLVFLRIANRHIFMFQWILVLLQALRHLALFAFLILHTTVSRPWQIHKRVINDLALAPDQSGLMQRCIQSSEDLFDLFSV